MVLFDNIEIRNLDKTKTNSVATLQYVDDSLIEKGIYIQDGKLGIKNPSPQEEVDVSGTINSKSLKSNLMTIWNPNDTENQDAILNINVAGASSGNPFIGMNIYNENDAHWSMGIDNVDNLFKIKSSYDFSGTGKLVLNQSGLLGIGVEAPTGMIHLPNTNSNKKILLYDVTGNQHQYSGIGTESNGSMRYQIQGTGTNHIFYSGASSSASSELMRITGMGRVGIGMTNPTSKVGISTSVNEWGLMLDTNMNGTGAGVLLNNTANGGRRFGIFSNSSNSKLSFYDLTSDKIFLTMGHDGSFSLSSGSTNQPRLDVTSSGNVGVGTSTPSSKFTVEGNALVQNGTLNIQTEPRTGTHSSAGNPLYVTGNIGTESNGVEIRHSDGTQGIGIGSRGLYSTSTNQNLNLFPNGTGRVGVGTTNPSQKLDVNGNLTVGNKHTGDPSQGMSSLILDGHMSGPANPGRPNIYHRASVGLGISSGHEMSFQVAGSSTIREAMRIKSNGKVGIGHTNPDRTLVVQDQGVDSYLSIQGAYQFQHAIEFKDGTTTRWIMYRPGGTNDFRFYNGGQDVICIKNSGYMGIGTNNPEVPLQIASKKNPGYSSYKTNIGSGVPVASWDGQTIYGYSVWDRIYVGGVEREYSIVVSSSIGCNGLILYSDKRIKKDIEDIPDSWEILDKLTPKRYRMIETNRCGYGFVAQEVREVVPEAIDLRKDYIPNIYQYLNFEKIDKNKVILDLQKYDVKLGDNIRVVEEGSTNPIIGKIIDIKDIHVDASESYIRQDFIVELESDIKDGNVLFVYGKEVDDYHVLDYNYLFTLNLDVTKKLQKKIKDLESEIQKKDKHEELLLSKIQSLEDRISKIDKLLEPKLFQF